jgi:hypothetical protein
MAVLLRHALSRGEGVILLPTIPFLLVRGITLVAKDVPIVLRIIPVSAVHYVAHAPCRLSASITGHTRSPAQPLDLRTNGLVIQPPIPFT